VVASLLIGAIVAHESGQWPQILDTERLQTYIGAVRISLSHAWSTISVRVSEARPVVPGLVDGETSATMSNLRHCASQLGVWCTTAFNAIVAFCSALAELALQAVAAASEAIQQCLQQTDCAALTSALSSPTAGSKPKRLLPGSEFQVSREFLARRTVFGTRWIVEGTKGFVQSLDPVDGFATVKFDDYLGSFSLSPLQQRAYLKVFADQGQHGLLPVDPEDGGEGGASASGGIVERLHGWALATFGGAPADDAFAAQSSVQSTGYASSLPSSPSNRRAIGFPPAVDRIEQLLGTSEDLPRPRSGSRASLSPTGGARGGRPSRSQAWLAHVEDCFEWLSLNRPWVSGIGIAIAFVLLILILGRSTSQASSARPQHLVAPPPDAFMPQATPDPSVGILPPKPPPAPCTRSQGIDCRGTRRCCSPDLVCYEKDQWWAACLHYCTPGVHQNDLPKWRTPWTCRRLQPLGSMQQLYIEGEVNETSGGE